MSHGAALPRLMALTPGRLRPGDDPAPLVARLGALLEAGVRLLQLREKALGAEDLAALWHALAPLRASFPAARWLLNPGADLDSIALASALGADGVQLGEAAAGQVAAARAALGPGALVGRSVHTVEGAAEAVRAGATHLVVAPIFAPSSKPGVSGAGLERLRAVVAAAGGVPVYALGGITPGRVASCLAAGARGVAVLGALAAGEPGAAARSFLARLAAHNPQPR